MKLSDFDVRRVEHCLAGFGPDRATVSTKGESGPPVICSVLESRRSILRRYGRVEQVRRNFNNYVREAQALVGTVETGGIFSVFPGDSRYRFEVPTFVKSRLLSDHDWPCILLPLDRLRHWGELERVAIEDLAFADKDNLLVWRGLTTGLFRTHSEDRCRSSRSHVATVEPRHEGIDIGFSDIVQIGDESSDVTLEVVRNRLRPKLSIQAQLRSKFLLSLEGNDVATGLKWMLYSNSTVVMPHPTCETWACEGFLKPFEHYLPVRHDLSDLDEVYEWCLAHMAECERIAQNGKRFIEAFLNERTEMEICRAVVSEYLSKARFDVTFDPFERALQAVRRPLPLLNRRTVVKPRFPRVSRTGS